MIISAQKDRNNERLLVIKNIDKIRIAEIIKILNTINFNDKRNWVISNSDINTAADLKLTNIKKY